MLGPYQMHDLQLFPLMIWVTFSFSMMSFDAQKFLILMKSKLPTFSFIDHVVLFVCIFCVSKKSRSIQGHKGFLLYFLLEVL